MAEPRRSSRANKGHAPKYTYDEYANGVQTPKANTTKKLKKQSKIPSKLSISIRETSQSPLDDSFPDFNPSPVINHDFSSNNSIISSLNGNNYNNLNYSNYNPEINDNLNSNSNQYQFHVQNEIYTNNNLPLNNKRSNPSDDKSSPNQIQIKKIKINEGSNNNNNNKININTNNDLSKTESNQSPKIPVDNNEKMRNSVINSLSSILTKFFDELVSTGKLDITKKNVNSTKELAEIISNRIENSLYDKFIGPFKSKNQEALNQYRSQFRSISFNLKDQKNPILRDRLLNEEITPEEIASMSKEDMLNPKYRKLAEEVRAEAISASVLKVNDMPRIRRTHKGEELIGENDSHHMTMSSDAVSFSSSKADSTTPENDDKPNTRTSIGNNKNNDFFKSELLSKSKNENEFSKSDNSNAKNNKNIKSNTTNEVYNNLDSKKSINNTMSSQDNTSSLNVKTESTHDEITSHNFDDLIYNEKNNFNDYEFDHFDNNYNDNLDFDNNISNDNDNGELIPHFPIVVPRSPEHLHDNGSTILASENELDDILRDNFDSISQNEHNNNDSGNKKQSVFPNLNIWSGQISMYAISSFPAIARQIGGPKEGRLGFLIPDNQEVNWDEIFTTNLNLEGRLSLQIATDYLSKITELPTKITYLINFFPADASNESRDAFDNLYNHLKDNDRCGVFGKKSKNIKDAYLFAMSKDSATPQFLNDLQTDFNYSADNDKLLVGVYVLNSPVYRTIGSAAPILGPHKDTNTNNAEAAGKQLKDSNAILATLGATERELLKKILNFSPEAASNPEVLNNPRILMDLVKRYHMKVSGPQ